MSIAERLDAGIADGTVFSAEDEDIGWTRVCDAETGEMIDNVTAFRLSDSTLWVMDVEGWHNDDSDKLQAPPGFEWPTYPGDYGETPEDGLREWRARPEVAAQEAKWDSWYRSPAVVAERDRLSSEVQKRHLHETKRRFVVRNRDFPDREWRSL